MDGRIALIGGGRIGEALLAGLITAGHEPGALTVAEPHAGRGGELAERYGVATVTTVAEAVDGAAAVVVVGDRIDTDMRGATELGMVTLHVLSGAHGVRDALAHGVTVTGATMHLVDDDWHASLRRIGAGLVPGGRLVFETRNPVRRAWEGWQQDPTERTMPAGRVLESERTSAPDRHGVVTMRVRTEFLDSGEVSEVDQHLQFRSAEQVRADLAAAGLRVERLSGDWHRTAFDPAEHPLMVVEAVRD